MVAAKHRLDTRNVIQRDMTLTEQHMPSSFLKKATAAALNVMHAKRIETSDSLLNSAGITEVCANTSSSSCIGVGKLHNCSKNTLTRSITAVPM